MSKQAVEDIRGNAPVPAFRKHSQLEAASSDSGVLKSVSRRTGRVAFILLAGCLAASIANAQTAAKSQTTSSSSTQNVNVVNTPAVSVSSLPPVVISGTPTVNVGSLPAVTLSGTPTVNANVTFPASQGVIVTAPGALTNVGRLPSQQVMLLSTGPGECTSQLFLVAPEGFVACFNMSDHPGNLLVITDVFWSATGTNGTTCIVALNPPGSSGYGPNFVSAAVVAADGFAAKNEHLTTGVKFAGEPVLGGPPYGGFSSCTPRFWMLHGYLIPNQ